MDQISMAIHTSLLIAGPGIQYRPVGQHGPSLVWDIKDISMALLALLVLEEGISLLAISFVIVFLLEEMYNHVLDAMRSFGIEELKGVVGSREMTVHTVRHKSLGVIHVG
jgi:hypothetical protein